MRKFITTLLIATGLAGCATQPVPEARQAGQTFQDCPDCPVMVVIPAGRFAMGFDGGEPERYEGPVREVTIKRTFAAGLTEVTVAQFRQFVAATGHQAARGCYAWDGKVATLMKEGNWEDPGYGRLPGPDEPVACVDWRDAAAYAKWLAELTGKPYRLLSEAEWEYAADAGSTARFPWGEDPAQGCKYGNIFDRLGAAATTAAIPPVACDDGYAGVAPVGQFAANAFGLQDMVGNVWEWTQDCYRMPNPPEPADGSALEVPNCDRRSVKGGSWITEAERQRPTFRGRDPEDRVSQVFGLRVARDLVP